MSRTKRHEPKHGEFKNLRSNRKRRTKNRQKSKAMLTKYVGLTNKPNYWDEGLRTGDIHAE